MFSEPKRDRSGATPGLKGGEGAHNRLKESQEGKLDVPKQGSITAPSKSSMKIPEEGAEEKIKEESGAA